VEVEGAGHFLLFWEVFTCSLSLRYPFLSLSPSLPLALTPPARKQSQVRRLRTVRLRFSALFPVRSSCQRQYVRNRRTTSTIRLFLTCRLERPLGANRRAPPARLARTVMARSRKTWSK